MVQGMVTTFPIVSVENAWLSTKYAMGLVDVFSIELVVL